MTVWWKALVLSEVEVRPLSRFHLLGHLSAGSLLLLSCYLRVHLSIPELQLSIHPLHLVTRLRTRTFAFPLAFSIVPS